MEFEKYYDEKINSQFKDVLEDKSKLNCSFKVDDYSIFKENYDKYKVRKESEKRTFQSLITEIRQAKKKRDDEQRKLEEYLSRKEEARLKTRNSRIKALSKSVRFTLVLALVAVYVYYIVFSAQRSAFIEGVGTAKYVWILIGVGTLIGIVSFFAIKTNHKYYREYDKLYNYKKVYYRHRVSANIWGTITLVLLISFIFVFINTSNFSSKYAVYLDFDEQAEAIMSKSKYDEDQLIKLYGEYYNFSDEEKSKLKQNEKFKEFILKYNNTKIDNLRESFDAITQSNASTTLKKAYDNYSALIYDQKDMVTSDIREKIVYYQDAYTITLLIKEIDDDILNKYDNVDAVKRKYNDLSTNLQLYVYNIKLINEFDNKYIVYNNFELEPLDNGSVSLTVQGDVNFSNLQIPISVGGKTITSIADVKNKTSLKEVVIPSTVTKIEAGAFEGCSGLTSIELPFVGTSNEATGEKALFGSIFGTTYNSDTRETLQHYYDNYQVYYIPKKLTNVKITSTTKIPSYAFENCTMIKNITLDKSIKIYCDKAFYGTSLIEVYYEGMISDWLSNDFESKTALPNYNCSNFYINNKKIEELTIPSNITTIKPYTLNNFIDLEELVVPSTVTKIEAGALSGCRKLMKIELPFVGTSSTATGQNGLFGVIFGETQYSDSVTVKQDGQIQRYTYYLPSRLTQVKITGATKLSYGAFSYITNLSIVILPDTIKTIEESSFVGNTLNEIYYTGTMDEWTKYNIDSKNQTLGKMTIYYFTEDGADETAKGNWWYISDGKIIKKTILY